MVSVLEDRTLKFNPDTLECVRKEVNLDKDSRIEEAVDILQAWVKKQQHFTKKDFSRDYLERTLINAKGMVERAKKRIDKLCTFKTLMPDLYPGPASEGQYDNLDKFVRCAFLPKMLKEHSRVSIFNITSDNYQSSDIHNFYKYIILLCEFLIMCDYNCGYNVILDFRNANILNFITKCTPMEFRQIMTLMTEGYGMRIKKIHLVTASKMIDTLVGFLKQVLSAKLAGRIHVHKTVDTLCDFVPKDVLPEEYGGEERSLKTLSDELRDRVTSKDFVEYFNVMLQAKTDESQRPGDKFNAQYAGMPGSFRALNVD